MSASPAVAKIITRGITLATCLVSRAALRSSIVIPLIDSDAVVAVLALYSKDLLAFTDDHMRMLELIGPSLAASMIDAVIADEDALYPVKRPVASLRLVKTS